jgi:hypothetical protein
MINNDKENIAASVTRGSGYGSQIYIWICIPGLNTGSVSACGFQISI